MAKFCTKCGKKLEEGEVCNCQETSEVLEDVTAAQPITPTVGAFDDFGSILKGSFTNPVSTIKNYNTDYIYGSMFTSIRFICLLFNEFAFKHVSWFVLRIQYVIYIIFIWFECRFCTSIL